MATVQTAPGPDADGAFRLGIVAAILLGLATIGLLYWADVLGPVGAGYVLLAVFPVYLLVVAVVLSIWLGFDKDATALRPVYRERESRSE